MVAFFINDQVADGRDISWIWDIDFEELAGPRPGTVVFAGGSRAHDLAGALEVRRHRGGGDRERSKTPSRRLGALVAAGTLPADAAVYAIANYTALPPVHAALDRHGRRRTGCRPSRSPTPAPTAEDAARAPRPTGMTRQPAAAAPTARSRRIAATA